MSEDARAGEVTPPTLERKLAAIFSTDVTGYSRLMGDDEVATVHPLTAYRQVLRRLIDQHHGRVVDSPGDNLLAEFASVVEAVEAAVAIQQELAIRNAELPANRRMLFRIGIHIGDVLTEGGRLYRDGVNITARLESLAEPGGICLSGTAREHLGNKLPLEYEYIGEREVKNIAKPVAVYKVQLESDGTALPEVSPEPPTPSPVKETGPPRRWPMTALAVMVVLLMGVSALVFRNSSPQLLSPAGTEPAEETPVLPLPDKPSIAVLPFSNMSNDPKQDYFSDGLTDTLITDLSQLSGLFVIARNSTFTYKGKP